MSKTREFIYFVIGGAVVSLFFFPLIGIAIFIILLVEREVIKERIKREEE